MLCTWCSVHYASLLFNVLLLIHLCVTYFFIIKILKKNKLFLTHGVRKTNKQGTLYYICHFSQCISSAVPNMCHQSIGKLLEEKEKPLVFPVSHPAKAPGRKQIWIYQKAFVLFLKHFLKHAFFIGHRVTADFWLF